MPFTFLHPALVIPLLHQRRRHNWLSATGLIAGSIAPDFEKFFRLKLANDNSHTFASIFYFSCPVALGLSFIFHLLVREPLLQHLPAFFHYRLVRFASFDWVAFFRRHYGGVLLSIVIGAALHLLWDSFTHRNQFASKIFPALNELIVLGNINLRLFNLLALLSTVAGSLIVAWSIWKMPVYPAVRPPAASALWGYWGGAVLVAGALLVERMLLMTEPRLLSIGITAIATMLVGVLASSIYVRVRQRRA